MRATTYYATLAKPQGHDKGHEALLGGLKSPRFNVLTSGHFMGILCSSSTVDDGVQVSVRVLASHIEFIPRMP